MLLAGGYMLLAGWCVCGMVCGVVVVLRCLAGGVP